MVYFAHKFICVKPSVVDPGKWLSLESILEHMHLPLVDFLGVGITPWEQQVPVEVFASEHGFKSIVEFRCLVKLLIVPEAYPILLSQVLNKFKIVDLGSDVSFKVLEVRPFEVGEEVLSGILWVFHVLVPPCSDSSLRGWKIRVLWKRLWDAILFNFLMFLHMASFWGWRIIATW